MKCEVKIPTKLNKSCEMGNSRYAICGIQVVPAATKQDKIDKVVHLVATDSRKLCVVRAEGEASEKCIIPGEMAPKNKKEHSGRVVWDERGGWTRYEFGTKLPQRSAEPIDGRFPAVDQVLPTMTNRHLTLILNPRLLYEAWEAMCGNTNETEQLTLLVEVPQVESLLPEGSLVGQHIAKLKEGLSQEEWGKRHLGFALNWHGEWVVETYENVNEFHADVMGKFDFFNDIKLDKPGIELYDTPDDLAYAIMRPIREQFESKMMLVESPVGMLCAGNFGVVMPCGNDEVSKNYDWRAEYKRLADKFVSDYRYDPKSEPPEPQSEPQAEGEAQDDSEAVQAEEIVSEPLVDDAGGDMEDDYNEEPDVTDLEPDMEPEIEPEAEFEPVANYEAAEAEDFDLDAIMDGIF